MNYLLEVFGLLSFVGFGLISVGGFGLLFIRGFGIGLSVSGFGVDYLLVVLGLFLVSSLWIIFG